MNGRKKSKTRYNAFALSCIGILITQMVVSSYRFGHIFESAEQEQNPGTVAFEDSRESETKQSPNAIKEPTPRTSRRDAAEISTFRNVSQASVLQPEVLQLSSGHGDVRHISPSIARPPPRVSQRIGQDMKVPIKIRPNQNPQFAMQQKDGQRKFSKKDILRRLANRLQTATKWDSTMRVLCFKFLLMHGRPTYNSSCQGYATSGGLLPTPRPDPADWPHPHNTTCTNRTQEPPFSWQRRAPYGIVLGSMKGGTQALMEYISQHPKATKRDQGKWLEDHFFEHKMLQYPNGIPQEENQILYGNHFREKFSDFFVNEAKTIARKDSILLDDTPWLFVGGSRIARGILCVAPWTKWIVTVRDPLARADSQYRYLNQARKMAQFSPMVDWEVWVDHDIQLLRETGVIQDWDKVNFEEFADSVAEEEAWNRYILRTDGSMQLVGKGLYAVQLSMYYKAMDEVGKPHSDLLVIQSEQLRNNTQAMFDRVLDHLDLEPHKLESTRSRHKTVIHCLPMPDSVKQKLEAIYEPYNHRLFKMLGWDNVWEKKVEVSKLSRAKSQ